MKKRMITVDNQLKLIVQRPVNLNIDKILQENPPEFSYERDVFLYLFDLWIDHFIWIKREQISIQNNMVPLHSQTMKRIRYDYQKYIDYLIKTGIWESDCTYAIGIKAKGYRFVDKYNRVFVKDEIANPKLIAKVEEDQTNNNLIIEEKYPGLIGWFDGLEIAYDEAMKFIENDIESQKKDNQRPSTKANLALKKSFYERSVMKIVNKDYSFKIDQKSGRIFSVLTNMKKELREFLSYKGEPLVCIDLSNSQPFLSLLLFNLDFYELNTTGIVNLYDLPSYINENYTKKSVIISEIKRFSRFIYNDHMNNKFVYQGHSVSDINKLRFLPACGKKGDYEGQNSDNLHEMALYCHTVRHGKLYQSILKAMPEGTEIKLAKQNVITILFASDTEERLYFINNRIIFKKLYPSIFHLFQIIKNDDHSILSVILQSIEAEIFLNRICKRIKNQVPSMPLFTIHDSVCTTITHETYLQKIVMDEIERAVGVKPHLKKEYWSNEKVGVIG